MPTARGGDAHGQGGRGAAMRPPVRAKPHYAPEGHLMRMQQPSSGCGSRGSLERSGGQYGGLGASPMSTARRAPHSARGRCCRCWTLSRFKPRPGLGTVETAAVPACSRWVRGVRPLPQWGLPRMGGADQREAATLAPLTFGCALATWAGAVGWCLGCWGWKAEPDQRERFSRRTSGRKR